MYSGCRGAMNSESHVGSASVPGLPSVSASRTAPELIVAGHRERNQDGVLREDRRQGAVGVGAGRRRTPDTGITAAKVAWQRRCEAVRGAPANDFLRDLPITRLCAHYPATAA